MKVRRRAHLVCRWLPDGMLVGIPNERRWMKVNKTLFELLDGARAWVDAGELAASWGAEHAEQAGKAIAAMLAAGVLIPDERPESDGLPKLWAYWGITAERFHVDSRDANYLVDSPERRAAAEAIVAEGAPPPIFKEYPGRPVVLLPRRPLPLATAIDDVFVARRTHREFTDGGVGADQLATILFYTFGPQRFLDAGLFGVQQSRVSSSAGGRHEVECYVVSYRVEGVPAGLYHYSPRQHALELLRDDVAEQTVADLSFGQEPSYRGAFTLFTTAVAARLAWKYRHPRAYRLWMYDAGHYGQTFTLTCTALGLGAFQTVAFKDSDVERFLGVDGDEEFAVYLLSAGVPRAGASAQPSDTPPAPPALVV